ncbi:hypothetical protein ABZ611_04640 [Streptomyces sp. NPDC007861]|uniref:hypothetical protein n=1 Tax=Streptomyces sp. NPDC007861 TaxID=3154893 RepID=UPI0033E9261A
MAWFLVLIGLASFVAGGAVACNIRGAATALGESSQRNQALRAAARGELGLPSRQGSAALFRWLGAAVGLSGLFLALTGLVLLTR